MAEVNSAEKILPPARRETTDVALRPMVIAGGLVLVGLVSTIAFARFLYPEALRDDRRPLVLPRFADPVLQPDTPADMRAFRAAQLVHLNGTGWLDPEHRRAHIPIADAMRDLARTGIPDWPTTPTRADR